MNKVILIGNLGRAPEVRFTENGTAMAKFPIATSEVYFNANKEKQEKTEWHNVVVWGKQAETCGQYLESGRQVALEGSIRTRTWEKDGQKHYMTEIHASRVDFLGSKGGTSPVQGEDSQAF